MLLAVATFALGGVSYEQLRASVVASYHAEVLSGAQIEIVPKLTGKTTTFFLKNDGAGPANYVRTWCAIRFNIENQWPDVATPITIRPLIVRRIASHSEPIAFDLGGCSYKHYNGLVEASAVYFYIENATAWGEPQPAEDWEFTKSRFGSGWYVVDPSDAADLYHDDVAKGFAKFPIFGVKTAPPRR